ncbi:MAG: low molecular weight phosphotyrosine protein phosphatase [Bacteroides sp.]|nr:low molecular weight phosphotyrosine protein phosphatase [Bacteroides sp.]MCM1413274.1 low molecular weight phosphotyrosine protein phosphatase [Bacteroides sp.]MCM1471416.1 low molecular weight phosphotyrosine protein phosphatase [Bacteroides sp.]
MIITNPSPRLKEALERLQDQSSVSILFICLGNICRSPAADGLLHAIVDEHRDRRWHIDSAGIGGWHVGDLPDRRMRIHGRRRGLEFNHICRQIRSTDFGRFDLIIGMDDANIADLRRLAPTIEAEKKILPMADFFVEFANCDHVPDPYYDGDQGFERVLDLLTDATTNLYDTIAPRLAPEQ